PGMAIGPFAGADHDAARSTTRATCRGSALFRSICVIRLLGSAPKRGMVCAAAGGVNASGPRTVRLLLDADADAPIDVNGLARDIAARVTAQEKSNAAAVARLADATDRHILLALLQE